MALPARPTTPISASVQTEGRVDGGGAAVTVRASEVELVKVPEVPVTVTVAEPVVAVPLAVSVKVLVLLLGLKDAVTPAGKPEADKLTLPVKPFSGVTEMVLVPLAP